MNKQLYISIVGLLLVFCCNGCLDSHTKKKVVLLADREAPLGWVHLKMYEDKSFKFISSGLRDEQVYEGSFALTHDTLFFSYKDSVPKVGKIAVIKKGFVSYIDGQYPESMEIKLNHLEK